MLLVGRGFTDCGKTRFWCHSERSEESLFDLSPMHREILRFAQNDKRTFSAAASAVPKSKGKERGHYRLWRSAHAFCHSERSEESLFLFMALNRREIPRSAR